ncbi:MAG: FAD-dependent oxidoreductase, partial [Gammaproteobacteria bacterium]|nr:FAD-dependent oxidoreductase [Gammaproteobacteria bacterium]
MKEGSKSRREFVAGLSGLVLTVKGGSLIAEVSGKASPDTAGRVILRGNSEYESQRSSSVWQAIKPMRYPDLIVQAESIADVVSTIRFAREQEMKIAVRGSGHNYVASYLRDGGILLDVSRLRDVEIDPSARVARVQPGIRGAEFAYRLESHQLCFPVAHVATVPL